MNKKQKAFTLIELIISIAIIAVSVVAIIGVFRLSIINSSNPITKKQAVLIAESLMEEVLSKPTLKATDGFAGPYTVSNRQYFDTITDYNNLTINGISNIYGVAIVGLENYSANITIQNQILGTLPATDVYLTTININGPNDNFVLKGYRINYDN